VNSKGINGGGNPIQMLGGKKTIRGDTLVRTQFDAEGAITSCHFLKKRRNKKSTYACRRSLGNYINSPEKKGIEKKAGGKICHKAYLGEWRRKEGGG